MEVRCGVYHTVDTEVLRNVPRKYPLRHEERMLMEDSENVQFW